MKDKVVIAKTIVATFITIDLVFVIISQGWSPVAGDVSTTSIAVRLSILASLAFWSRWARSDHYSLVLFLLALISLFHFNAITERRVGDGFFYYAYVQSFWKDFDLDFANQYQQYGISRRENLKPLTDTGHRRNTFSVGPAVFWSPFFGLGELVARAKKWIGYDVNLLGNGPIHWSAVSFGTFVYGLVSVFLLQSFLRQYFSEAVAFAGTVLTWWGTSFYWYMVQQPLMSHTLSTFCSVLFLLQWKRNRLGSGISGALLMGLLGGLTVCVRWQNAILLLLPGIDCLRAVWNRERQLPVHVFGLAVGVLIGILPQLLAWHTLYGTFLMIEPPQGANFLHWTSPFILETLFSSRHGLLSWTPVLWLGYIGLLPLLYRRRSWSLWAMGLSLVLMTYVNMVVADWWAGGSYSNRRFDSALPVLALGIAFSAQKIYEWIRCYPAIVVTGLLCFFPLWNLILMEQYREYRIHPENMVSFSRITSDATEFVLEKVGYPFAWPVNWWFTWKNDISFDHYDLLFGRYLFYPHRGQTTSIEVGENDQAFIGDGWRPPSLRNGRWVRVTRLKKARIYVPLEAAWQIDLVFRLSARPTPAEVSVEVNGESVGSFVVFPGFNDYRLRVPERMWRSGLNVLDFLPELTEPDQKLLLDHILLRRRTN